MGFEPTHVPPEQESLCVHALLSSQGVPTAAVPVCMHVSEPDMHDVCPV
jgi:hypothetical protein